MSNSYQVLGNIYFSVYVNCLLYCKCNAFIISFETMLNFENLLQILSWKQKKKSYRNKKWSLGELLQCLMKAQRNNASLIVYNRQLQKK